MKYGKIEDGNLSFAPAKLFDNGQLRDATPELLAKHGYLPINVTGASNAINMPWQKVECSFEEKDGAIELRYSVTPKSYEISKFKLAQAILDAGLHAHFQSFLDNNMSAEFLWNASVALDSDNPMLIAAAEAIKQSAGITDEQMITILHNAAM